MAPQAGLTRSSTTDTNQPIPQTMTINRLKRRFANRIVASTSAIIPSRVQSWAQGKVETLADVPVGTSPDGTSDNTSGGSLVLGESSSSSLPMLELALENTKINPRGCLKKTSSAQSDAPKAAKRVGFAVDDVLVTCMASGARLTPKTRTDSGFDAFLARSGEKAGKRREENKARRLAREAAGMERAEDSSSDEDSDDSRDPWDKVDDSDPEDADEAIFDPNDTFDTVLQARINEAQVARTALGLLALASGALDFALYVTRSGEPMKTLEDLADDFCKMTKIASYRGEERRHAYRGIHAATKLPREYYDDFRTAMSGKRAPAAVLKMPVVPKAAAAANEE